MPSSAFDVNARSPLRIDFVGMTDHIGFCREFGGDLLNATVNKYIYAAARWRDDGRIVLRAPDQHDLAVEIPSAADLDPTGELGLAQEVLRRFDIGRGLEVVTYSELPGGAGLGSSSTIATCLIAVLDALTGYRMTAYEMAETARSCEAAALRTTYGWQDQYSPVTGGGVKFMRHWPAATGRGIEVDHIRLSPATLANLERGLVVAFSGISRPAKSILDHAWSAVERRDQAVLDAFRSMSDMAGEIRRMLTADRVDDLGPALAEVWRLHRSIHPDVTNDRLDELYDLALRHGATGGKCCGAGGGGTMLFYAPPGRDYAVRQALREANAPVFDISLDMHGLLIW
jgi:D-glycero-alpha-D-manno-heptose-7-phosphate kinase